MISNVRHKHISSNRYQKKQKHKSHKQALGNPQRKNLKKNKILSRQRPEFSQRKDLFGTLPPHHDQARDHGMGGCRGDLRRHRFTLTSAKPSKGLFYFWEADAIPRSGLSLHVQGAKHVQRVYLACKLLRELHHSKYDYACLRACNLYM